MTKLWKLRSWRPSPTAAFAVGVLALLASLSMPAQAAMERLAAGTVGTAQLKNGAVTTPKLRDGAVTGRKLAGSSVTGAKIANGSVGLGDLSPGARPKLPRALVARYDIYTPLPPGGVAITQRDLPRGRWFVVIEGIFFVHTTDASCVLTVNGEGVDHTYTSNEAANFDNFTIVTTLTLPATRTVGVRCASGGTASVDRLSINAIEVR